MTPVLAAAIIGQLSTSPMKLTSTRAGGASVRMVEIDLSDERVHVDLILPKGFPGTSEPFRDLVRRHKPLAAVNGAYFDKKTLRPIGDIGRDGKVLHQGRMGTVFTIDREGVVDFHRVVRHRTYAWGDKRLVLGCGPALLLDGKLDVAWEREGFRDPSVTGRTQRMAIGIRQDQTLLLVHIRDAVSFNGAAEVMKALGCYEAMNLDAGASLAMAFGEQILVKPGRSLTNVIGVWVKS